MQLTRTDYSPSCEGTQRPRPARATREAALDESDVSSKAKNAGSMLAVPQKHPRRKTCENPQEHELTTSGEPDDGKSIKSGSVGGTRKPTVEILQGGGCLPYDVGVLYLFVEGSYVGEAYCPAFMGRRVSEWEATAQRQADAAKAKATASASANVRAQIQEEIDTTKKQRKRATREQEYSRQFDRQREEIHPAHVLETLATLHPPAPSSLRLPEAKPDPDREYPVQILPIRPYETENDS